MKKFIAVLVCLVLLSAILPMSLSAAGVPIDATNFPDPVFREYVRQIDTDKNGTLSDTERLAVTSILLEKKNNQLVTSIVGIKYFSDLECLSSKESNLIEADLSGMVKLRSFSCGEGNLQSLNLSGCTALDFVSCQFNRLTQIDLTGCSALIDLMCNHNRLTKLDVSDCVQLEQISIYENQIASIDVSKNKKLIHFTVVPQEVTVQKFQKNGKWTIDLGALVGKENLGKITYYNIGELNAATGLLTFDTEPTDFNYTYKASEAYRMDVHVTLYRGVLPIITANNITIDPRDAALDPFKEPGLNLNAVDAEDGNLTANVKAQVKTVAVWGSAASKATVSYNTIPAVDTKKPGFYIISYTVKDSSGNTAALDVYITVRTNSSTESGPFSIITRVSNTSTGSITSSNGMSSNYKNDTSALSSLSAASGIATPPMGMQDSGATILLAAILVSAAVLILINRRRKKAD